MTGAAGAGSSPEAERLPELREVAPVLAEVAPADPRRAPRRDGGAADGRLEQDRDVVHEPEDPRGPGGLDNAVSAAHDAPAAERRDGSRHAVVGRRGRKLEHAGPKAGIGGGRARGREIGAAAPREQRADLV